MKILKNLPVRSMMPYKSSVTDVRHVALVQEVQIALSSWISNNIGWKVPGVLIGGLAMSFYAKPRTTENVDLLFLSDKNIPGADQEPGFTRYRPGAFRENRTHVDIEITHPRSFASLPLQTVRKVYVTAVVHGELRVASLEGMIALKLISAEAPGRKMKDLADVVQLLLKDPGADMKDWDLTENQERLLEECRKDV